MYTAVDEAKTTMRSCVSAILSRAYNCSESVAGVEDDCGRDREEITAIVDEIPIMHQSTSNAQCEASKALCLKQLHMRSKLIVFESCGVEFATR